ncbi:MAG: hypothetical protein AB3N14_11520 [Flavobacteriaceae bacterium]
MTHQSITIAATPNSSPKAHISYVQIRNEGYFKISDSDTMRPFFMSIVSDSNHWMFMSSNGGLTAGRKNSEYALFPYYTDDKITESSEITGGKSIFRIELGGKSLLWEPFSDRNKGSYKLRRNIYKNSLGNKIIFEEINQDLGLSFRCQWQSSNTYGFIRRSTLVNLSDEKKSLSVLDGIQNLVPYGVSSDVQNKSSNLVDAYKRSELIKKTGLGIYALSAIIVDKAEPSEALKANIAWSLGLKNPKYLLSSLQLENFRNGISLKEEEDIKAEKGAYFVNTDMVLGAADSQEWMIIANVNQDHADIAQLNAAIQEDHQLSQKVEEDIELGSKNLRGLCAASDGLQLSADILRNTRHFSNTLFNIMRGGIFDHNYDIEKWDFRNYLLKANKEVFGNFEDNLKTLPELFSAAALKSFGQESESPHLNRLCLEYLPLKFSRRHGDPSRPWNRFSINTRSEVDGSKILDYEGNWRDIFQNWEALAHSYPEFTENMMHKFLNASTFEGYNPYRVTKDGFDWEIIEPDDPWSYIGYWGDHQIIYLLKFLEIIHNYYPGQLEDYFSKDLFVYARVPYKIKGYKDILKNPKDTIDFDHAMDKEIRQERKSIGADGALLKNNSGVIHQVNFIEKILATVLCKLSNFIPEAGIWLNTQRPEWNDANNALVGNGVSMVTLYYLRRFLKFFELLLSSTALEEFYISEELVRCYMSIASAFVKHKQLLDGKIGDRERKSILDAVGEAGSDYRLGIYERSFSGEKEGVSLAHLQDFVGLALQYLEHSIRANKRDEGMYHAYNLMTVENEKEVSISYLGEMLEGQVAVLSSGYLSSKENLAVLDGLKGSRLFRADQYSYLLYPNKDLPRFTEKNNIDERLIAKSALLQQMAADGHTTIVKKDGTGNYHFNGNFNNGQDLQKALDQLADSEYSELAIKDRQIILDIFEEVFNHKAFTGRSGTFFGYEGLGSIYWHMVSKLLLATQECCLKAVDSKESAEITGGLFAHYYEINEGIGVHKPPSLYGAFPTDPYSHTPAGKGAQQPGMTGQVKEDILCRMGELGVSVRGGRLHFDPCLLRKEEFIMEPRNFTYVNVHSETKELQLESGSLSFTYCQVPVVYQLATVTGIELVLKSGQVTYLDGTQIGEEMSRKVFERSDEIVRIHVQIKDEILR